MPAHHPDASLLAAYASGACSEAVGVIIASHLSLCATCAAAYAELEAVGGALLEDLPAEPLANGALEQALALLDAPSPITAPPAVDVPDAVFPGPLRRFAGFGAHEVPWQRVTRGLSSVRLPTSHDGEQLRLMRIAAGARMPSHHHAGREITLVLSGGFSDESGHFLRGDLADITGNAEHAPRADEDSDCICLALNEGDIKLSGVVGRLVTPFVRF